MKTVLQRVLRAAVHVDERQVGAIGRGVVLLVGVERGDTPADAARTARKVQALRIFPGRTPMDRTLADVGGGCLVVSQFTLLGSVRRGNRPGFDRAEDPIRAEPLYEQVAEELRRAGLPVATGVFGAGMRLELVNDGPVTLWIETRAGRIVD